MRSRHSADASIVIRRACAFLLICQRTRRKKKEKRKKNKATKKKEKGTRFGVPSLYTSGCSLGRRGLDARNVDGVARCIQGSGHFDFLSDELLGLVGIVQFVRGACVILQHQVAFGFVNLPHKSLGLLTLVGLLAHRGLGLRWLGLRCRILRPWLLSRLPIEWNTGQTDEESYQPQQPEESE